MSRKFRTLRLRLIEGKIGEVAYQLTKVHFAHFQESGAQWRPEVNVFQCASCFQICVALAGVSDENIKIEVGRGRLRISGHREPPEPLNQQEQALASARKPVRVIAMEIDHGKFERDLQIPEGYDYTRLTTEWDNGLFWIRMPRIANA